MGSNSKMKTGVLSAFGAFLCITALSYLHLLDDSSFWLIPPFGASMVLTMSVHASPLAHPRNVLFGHIFSALAGVLVSSIFGLSAFSLGLAVGLAVFIMMVTNTVHPPAGANPIIAIIGEEGVGFVIMPVTVGALVIIFFAIIYNRFLNRKYFTLADWREFTQL